MRAVGQTRVQGVGAPAGTFMSTPQPPFPGWWWCQEQVMHTATHRCTHPHQLDGQTCKPEPVQPTLASVLLGLVYTEGAGGACDALIAHGSNVCRLHAAQTHTPQQEKASHVPCQLAPLDSGIKHTCMPSTGTKSCCLAAATCIPCSTQLTPGAHPHAHDSTHYSTHDCTRRLHHMPAHRQHLCARCRPWCSVRRDTRDAAGRLGLLLCVASASTSCRLHACNTTPASVLPTTAHHAPATNCMCDDERPHHTLHQPPNSMSWQLLGPSMNTC